jgi:hypothetical protein
MVDDFLNIGLAGPVLFQKAVHIKDNTFINTGIRHAGVQNSAVNKNDFAGFCRKILFVKGDMKSPFYYTDDLIFYMPVVGHHILGMGVVHMVKFKGEIIGSPLLILVEM